MRIITLCGSLKFQEEMQAVAEKLALECNCVLTPVFPVTEGLKLSKKQLEELKKAHFRRIELSDEIYVINKYGYIGESTKLEIEYANKLNKKVVFYE